MNNNFSKQERKQDMKKEYMIPQTEVIKLKSEGCLLTESMERSETEVSGGLASEWFDDGESDEDW